MNRGEPDVNRGVRAFIVCVMCTRVTYVNTDVRCVKYVIILRSGVRDDTTIINVTVLYARCAPTGAHERAAAPLSSSSFVCYARNLIVRIIHLLLPAPSPARVFAPSPATLQALTLGTRAGNPRYAAAVDYYYYYFY